MAKLLKCHLISIPQQSASTPAYDQEYISRDKYGELFRFGTGLLKQTVAFIVSMVKPGSGVKHMKPQRNFKNEVWEMYERITGNQRPELYRDRDD